MKLLVGLANGTILTYEGTYDEVTKIGEKLVGEFGPEIINLEEAEKLGGQQIQMNANGSRRWNNHSVRKLLGLLYGEQMKLVKFLVEHGGTATYAEITKHMGYGGQHLSGILSPITRNAQ